jgi:hypothetical protein
MLYIPAIGWDIKDVIDIKTNIMEKAAGKFSMPTLSIANTDIRARKEAGNAATTPAYTAINVKVSNSGDINANTPPTNIQTTNIYFF